MSIFRVPVVPVRAIETIPGADRIELAVVGDYRSIIKKGAHRPGDLAVYLPEAALLPEWMLKSLGFWKDGDDGKPGQGMLNGKGKNRIKAKRLLGCLSQGILYPLVQTDGGAERAMLVFQGQYGESSVTVSLGDDVAELLGVTKYEPEIPASMLGEVCSLFGQIVTYDAENLKAYPEKLAAGEEVFVTEKVHGSQCALGVIPGLCHENLFFGGDVYVTSKGVGGKGLSFMDVPKNAGNLYVQTLLLIEEQIRRLAALAADPTGPSQGGPLHIGGEVIGPKVQDLTYGLTQRAFRGFAMYAGPAGQGRHLDPLQVREIMLSVGIVPVDLLYHGPYDRAKVAELRDGKTVTGGGVHIREGVVVVPARERYDNEIGRVILKDISADYLTRDGGTEYN